MAFYGTPNDDDIDQERQAIPAGPLYGLAGDDRITVTSGLAIGGAGSDIIVAGLPWATAAYWDSPRGIVADLGAGTVEDGFGTIDRLIGIRAIQGSDFDDLLRGGDADEFFFGGLGNNRVEGGKGFDTVSYYFEKSTAADIRYDAASDTFTVIKRFSNGDHGTDTLSGVERIEFTGEGADNVVILRAHYVGDFRPGATAQAPVPAGAGITQLKTGDFNGDGHADILMVTQVGTGTRLAPSLILLGDGKGGLRDGTSEIFGQAPMKIVGGGRTLVADVNGDGRSDIFQFDFGDDAPPFPGGINSLYLSSADGRLVDVSATLPQRMDTNHGGSAGDLNGDGHIDILVNTLDKGNLLLINDGHGRFTEHRSLLVAGTVQETSTFSGIVDVNGDLAPDLILGTWDGNPSNAGSKILLNDGRGNMDTAAPIALPASGVAHEIVLDVKSLDLNGDGFADLMLSISNGGATHVFYQTGYIQLLVNDGTGHFHDETAIRLPQDKDARSGNWLTSLSPVDFDNDGFTDILAESVGANAVSKIYRNQGDGTFALSWESSPDQRVQAADMDSDGMPDLVLTTSAGAVSILLNKLTNSHVYHGNFGGSELAGSDGNDVFRVRSGDNVFDGRAGLDTAILSGQRDAYRLEFDGARLILDGKPASVRLDAVERVVFDDQALAFDIDGVAGQSYRLYQAAFDRAPDRAGLGFWMTAMDRGAALLDVAAEFVASPELTGKYGELNDDAFVDTIYHNVLHREPDAPGLAFWQGYLEDGGSRSTLLMNFSESSENQEQTFSATEHGIVYLPFY